jgi:hypothetical protein
MNVVLIASYAHLQGKILNDIGKIYRLNWHRQRLQR